jgi:histidyl-tRNA synthetase
MGMERLVALMAVEGDTIASAAPAVYLLTLGNAAARAGARLLETLRTELPQLRMVAHGSEGSFKSQLRAADRTGARIALILGEDELKDQRITVKPMMGGDQQTIAWQDLATTIRQINKADRQ